MSGENFFKYAHLFVCLHTPMNDTTAKTRLEQVGTNIAESKS